ncbi:Aa_trans domain-containing protein [Psidium guajava]|nr:Aa_trans domain-containing protein [Psidium guajava]
MERLTPTFSKLFKNRLTEQSAPREMEAIKSIYGIQIQIPNRLLLPPPSETDRSVEGETNGNFLSSLVVSFLVFKTPVVQPNSFHSSIHDGCWEGMRSSFRV